MFVKYKDHHLKINQMNINIDNLKKLIESIRNINFFQRLFSWGKIRQQLIDGVTYLQKMQ